MISTIGKYTVEAELGRGGFGRVYRAFDPDVKRQVAIKVLIAEGDADLLKRFQFEVGTTGNLRHKNIVTLYECGEESGVPYLVMELLEGQPLDVVIRDRKQLTLLEKVSLMTQVAEGLAYAHTQGVIHRDVKPGNIMLLRDGSVKIMDFGIARAVNKSTMVTREGFIVGTIPYMAPELFEPSGKADEQADVFAYGAVYYELLTRVHPFSVGQDIYGTIRRIQNIEPEAICRMLPEAPEGLELLVHRAIAKDREIRYQNFSELLLDGGAVLVDLQRERAAAILAEVRSLTDSAATELIEAKLLQVVELDPGNREARQLRNALRERSRKAGMGKRASTLLAESEALIQKRQFGEAVQVLENALRLNRDDSAIQSRLSEASARLKAHLEASKLVAEARRDQQRGHLPDALRRLIAALELDPDHVDAMTLRPRVENEIARRAREQAAQDAFHRASQLLAHGSFDEALAALKPIEDDRILAEQVEELRTQIAQEKEEAERRRRAEQFRMAITKVRETLQIRDHDRAAQMLKLIESRFGGEQTAVETLAGLRSQLDSQIRADEISRHVQEARELMRRNALREAVDLLNSVQPRFPEDSTLERLRESAATLLAAQQRADGISAAVQEANALRAEGNPRQALELIDRARRQFGEDPVLSSLAIQATAEIEQQRYAAGLEDLLRKAKALGLLGRDEEVVRAIEAAPEYKDEQQVKVLLAAALKGIALRKETAEVEAALERARALEAQGSLPAALTVLEQAQEKYPGNGELARVADGLRGRIAEQKRRAAVAKHQELIGKAIEDHDWDQAEAVLAQARREFPQEQVFSNLSEAARNGRRDDQLVEAANQVRARLAEGDPEGARKLLIEAREKLDSDDRLTVLEQEIAQRVAYESALRQAEQDRSRGDLDTAERRLAKLMETSCPDDRPQRLLGLVRDQRIERGLRDANAAVGQGDFDTGLMLMQTLRAAAPAAWAEKIDAAYQEAEARRVEESRALEAKRRADEERAAQAERERVARLEKERLEQAERDKAALEAKRRAEEAEAAQAERDRLARIEKERREQAARDKAALEAKRREEQEKAAQAERDRVARIEKERLEQAAREKAALETKRRAEEEKAAQAERDRLGRIEKERLEQAERDKAALEAKRREEQERAAQAERDRVARIEKERLEQAERDKAALEAKRREEQEKAAQAERDRVARIEKERLEQAARDKAILETKRRAEEAQAAQAERDRLARIEKERLDQAAREKAALEAKRRTEEERVAQAEREQAALAARRRAEEQRAAPAELTPPKKPLPAKLAAGIAAAIVAVAGAVVVIPRLIRTPDTSPALVAFEIRTDPPGASIKVAGQSCVTPNCRLQLPPGDYKVEAQLNGYKPEARNVTVQTSAATQPAVQFSLSPIVPNLPPKVGAAIGTLVVNAGIPDALVFIDKTPRSRTGPDGNLTVKLEAKAYDVSVQKSGYENPPERRVQISQDGKQTLTFTLTQQNATLQLRGAPSGVELRVNGSLIGKTDGAAVFNLPVRPAEGTLQVTLGTAKREVAGKFEAGQTLALDWASIAPVSNTPKLPVEPTRAELETQAWERARNASDPAELTRFVTDYPNSNHVKEAQGKIDDLAWGKTNQKDAQALRAYLTRFPNGSHAREASAQMAELAWNGADKNNAQALKTFLEQFPGSSHERDAKDMIERIEKQRAEADLRNKELDQRSKEERAKQEQSRAEAQAIQTVVDRFNGAFSSPDPKKAFKEVWPGAPSVYTDFIPGDKNNKVVLSLGQCANSAINGNTMTASCNLTLTGSIQGKPRPGATRGVNLTLQKSDSRWIVTGVTPR